MDCNVLLKFIFWVAGQLAREQYMIILNQRKLSSPQFSIHQPLGRSNYDIAPLWFTVLSALHDKRVSDLGSLKNYPHNVYLCATHCIDLTLMMPGHFSMKKSYENHMCPGWCHLLLSK